MDMTFSSEQLTFRDEVRAWIADAMPDEMKRKADAGAVFENDESMAWHQILHEKGWVAPDWPVEVGGPGWDSARRFIFQEELLRANTPALSPFGLTMVGPLLIQYGSEEQRQRFLPPILSGDEIWCQGFSEPNAGSDLASLRTRGVVSGDEIIVQGQKTWTSFAQQSDWCILVVRTDPEAPKHKGLTFLLVDMETPGITIRPLIEMTGHAWFNEVFFDEVRVPLENVVGEINGGWDIVMTTLSVERGSTAQHARLGADLDLLIRAARETPRGEGRASDDPLVRQTLASFAADMMVLRMSVYRNAWAVKEKGLPGPEGSTLKVLWSEIDQRMKAAAVNILGPRALVQEGDPLALDDGYWAYEALWSRASTIYAGTSEVQRNIIATRVLGLPR